MSGFASRLFISTMAEDASALAREYALGIELAEFCTAYNMDECFAPHDARAKELMSGISRRTFHGPYSELCPAAIDPLVRRLTADRYAQALDLALSYGIRKVILHTGFIPQIYFPEWFIPESIDFWRSFLDGMPEDVVICLENVMETGAEVQYGIVAGVDDRRLRVCLDVGHAYSHAPCLPISEWIDTLGPYLSHVHLHNNDGKNDFHHALGDGEMDMASVIDRIERVSPDVTYALENMQARPSVDWLRAHHYI